MAGSIILGAKAAKQGSGEGAEKSAAAYTGANATRAAGHSKGCFI